MKIEAIRIHLSEKLSSKLAIGQINGCWLWTGAGSDDRYGVITHQRQHYSTHRVAYELWKGPIPFGLFVCHSCDNPACCNPDHLFLGTPKENTDDMVSKGRRVTPASAFTKETIRQQIATGRKTGQKLLPDDVLTIRQRVSRGENRKLICAEFGISNSTISAIVTGQNWRSV